MPGSCSYAGGNPSKNLCCEFRGIFEREKLVANISEVGEHEIQISQQRVLVSRLLCRHGREEHDEDKRIYRQPDKRG